jgi:hypothetical protein
MSLPGRQQAVSGVCWASCRFADPRATELVERICIAEEEIRQAAFRIARAFPKEHLLTFVFVLSIT